MGIIDRLFGKKPTEEKHWAGGYNLPISGGWLPSDSPWNFWQQGKDVQNGMGETATVHACIDAYAQTISTLYGKHYKRDKKQTKKLQENSPLAKVLFRPNDYQSRSDLMLNLVKDLLINGNGYLLANRNERGEISALHNVFASSTQVYIDNESKSVFYAVGDNPMVSREIELLIPARDVLHVRLYCPRHPLVGVSPLRHAAASIAANSAVSRHQATFFNEMSRPSGILYTEERLNREQMTQMRQAWEDQAKGMNSGRIPILSNGIKWQALGISSQDAQLAEAFNMTINDIARAFRVPLPMIQQHDQGSTYNNVEQLYSHWLSGGLGFLLEHIELTFDRMFDLPKDEFTEFDTNTLMRTDFQGKVDGFTKLVQGGLMTPNEARQDFSGLPPVEHGDVPHLQAQMVPLGWVEQQAAAEEANQTPVITPPADQEEDPEESKSATIYQLKKAMS